MKRTVLTLLAASSIAAAIPAIASAQAWMSTSQRQYQMDQQLDAGVRSGQLTRDEAAQLRAEFRDVVTLENRYRSGGLTYNEQADLQRRYDVLEQRIQYNMRDNEQARGYGYRDRYDDDRYDNRGNGYAYGRDRWNNLGQRQARFNERLNRAVEDNRLTSRQAANLRSQFNSVVRLERQYAANGYTASERADIDARMDQLQQNFRAEISANQYGYGYGQAPNLFDYLFGLTR
jgi:hypothetical protein